MKTALLLYNEFCDMDYNDYNETRENDILLIQELNRDKLVNAIYNVLRG